jgi:hypothetical protein
MMVGERKAARRRLVKAEVRVLVAVKLQQWADDITYSGKPDGRMKPFDEWATDDPFVRLCRLYEFTPEDLVKVLEGLAEESEYRAIRTGYEEAWSE